jgi:uncharacterized repeat protein (TIGR01451 family)
MRKSASAGVIVEPVRFASGDTITYTIELTNNGPQAATNVDFTDTLSPNMTFVNITGGSMAAFCSHSAGVITCTDVTSIADGATETLTYEVSINSVPASQTDTFTNIAEVTGSDQEDPDSTPGNSDEDEDDYARVDLPWIYDPPFGQKINDGGNPVLRWTMVWFNSTLVDAVNAVVSDPILPGTTFRSGPTCQAFGDSITTNCTFDSATNRIIWEGTIAALEVGGTLQDNRVEISYVVNVAPDVFSLTNIASIEVPAFGPAPFRATTSSNWSAEPRNIAYADPIITKSVEPPFSLPGEQAIWSISISNPSGVAAQNILVVDEAPAELEILSATATDGTVVVDGQKITFTQPILNSLGSTTITIVTRVRPDTSVPFIIANRAIMTGDNFNPKESTAILLSLTELPATGETPFLSIVLRFIALIGAGAAALIAGLWFRRKRMNG